MTPHRTPGGVWTWKGTLLVVIVVLAPMLALGLGAAPQHSLYDLVQSDGVIMAPAALVSALAFYVAWRLTEQRLLGWLSLAVTIIACQVVLSTGLQLVGTPAFRGGMAYADLTILLTIVVCAVLARYHEVPWDPAQLGFFVGTALALPRALTGTGLSGLELASWTDAALVWGVLLVGCVAAIAQVTEVSVQIRWRLSAVVVLLGAAHVALFSESDLAAVVTLGGDALGMTILLTTALSVFGSAVHRAKQHEHDIARRLEHAEATTRVEHSRLHEIKASLAGITSATRLIYHESALIPAPRRALLEEMVQSELGRLGRLLADGEQPRVPEPRTVDLDETIARLALAHELRGTTVRWEPTGCQVAGEPDAVTEVLNILLDNAAKHGGSETEVVVNAASEDDDTVEIAVSDSGPGIGPEVRARLFEYGTRGARSSGWGIGLNIAHDLAHRQGGYLTLRDTPRTTFVVGLQAARAAAGDAHGATARLT